MCVRVVGGGDVGPSLLGGRLVLSSLGLDQVGTEAELADDLPEAAQAEREPAPGRA